jgi:ubiquitin-conjugating enzyme E2 O
MDVSVLPLERLTRLYDSLEQIEDDDWDEEASERDSNEEYSEGIWLQDADGVWRYEKTSDDDEWEETDEDPEEMDIDIPWVEADSSLGLDDDSLNLPPSNATLDLTDSVSPLPTSPSTSPEMSQELVVNTAAKDTVEIDDNSLWKRFEILSSAPTDHAFYSTSAGQPSRTFLTRLTKEYRALSNSLPGEWRS